MTQARSLAEAEQRIVSLTARLRIILAALAVFAVVALPASGGGPQPLGSWAGGGQHSGWIEQQAITSTTPTNSFGRNCLWSVNDHELWESWGYLDAGSSASRDKCVVSDYPHTAPYGMSTVGVFAKSPNLVVTVCFEPQTRCFSPAPVLVERQYRYTFCGHAHYDPSDPVMVEIPGSSGGRGIVTTVSTTISNPTDRRVRDVIARVGFASDISLFLGWPDAVGCLPTFPYTDESDYPFAWTIS